MKTSSTDDLDTAHSSYAPPKPSQAEVGLGVAAMRAIRDASLRKADRQLWGLR